MMEFITWFLTELPGFLMSEPIIYFVGFAMLFVTVGLIKEILWISR